MGDTAVLTRRQGRTQRQTKQPRLWNVVLLDDQEHSYEYVIEMLQRVFGHPLEKAYQVAKTVDDDGRAVCLTTHLELGELKIEQIHTYGPDCLIAECKGAMSAELEPALGEGDDHRDSFRGD